MKRTKHNYTSELELKSLLIRSKNKKLKTIKIQESKNNRLNRMIDRYIKTYTKLNNKSYVKKSDKARKKKHIKIILKNKIVNLSEHCYISKDSNERFGRIILLMIKNILTKPNFSGYTYHTEFYSDAISKILKYLHNFDHTKVSKITDTYVNAFSYISQIIHNSVIYVINKKKKEQINIEKQVSDEILQHNLNITDHRKDLNSSTYELDNMDTEQKEYTIDEDDDIVESIKQIISEQNSDERILIHYPKTMTISMDQYNELHPLLKKVSIVRDINDL